MPLVLPPALPVHQEASVLKQDLFPVQPVNLDFSVRTVAQLNVTPAPLAHLQIRLDLLLALHAPLVPSLTKQDL